MKHSISVPQFNLYQHERDVFAAFLAGVRGRIRPWKLEKIIDRLCATVFCI
jgi:hypothetical protein